MKCQKDISPSLFSLPPHLGSCKLAGLTILRVLLEGVGPALQELSHNVRLSPQAHQSPSHYGSVKTCLFAFDSDMEQGLTGVSKAVNVKTVFDEDLRQFILH